VLFFTDDELIGPRRRFVVIWPRTFETSFHKHSTTSTHQRVRIVCEKLRQIVVTDFPQKGGSYADSLWKRGHSISARIKLCLGFVTVLAALGLAIATTCLFFPLDTAAGILLLPLDVWLLYATILALAVAIKNRGAKPSSAARASTMNQKAHMLERLRSSGAPARNTSSNI